MVAMDVYFFPFKLLFVLAWTHFSIHALGREFNGDKFDFLIITLLHETHNNRLRRMHITDVDGANICRKRHSTHRQHHSK